MRPGPWIPSRRCGLTTGWSNRNCGNPCCCNSYCETVTGPSVRVRVVREPHASVSVPARALRTGNTPWTSWKSTAESTVSGSRERTMAGRSPVSVVPSRNVTVRDGAQPTMARRNGAGDDRLARTLNERRSVRALSASVTIGLVPRHNAAGSAVSPHSPRKLARTLPPGQRAAGRPRSGRVRGPAGRLIGTVRPRTRYRVPPSFAVPTIRGRTQALITATRGWAVRVPRDLQELALRVDRATDPLFFTSSGARRLRPRSPSDLGVTIEQVLEAHEAAAAYRSRLSRIAPASDDNQDA